MYAVPTHVSQCIQVYLSTFMVRVHAACVSKVNQTLSHVFHLPVLMFTRLVMRSTQAWLSRLLTGSFTSFRGNSKHLFELTGRNIVANLKSCKMLATCVNVHVHTPYTCTCTCTLYKHWYMYVNKFMTKSNTISTMHYE